MGLFTASEGLARFQNVKTHPDAAAGGSPARKIKRRHDEVLERIVRTHRANERVLLVDDECVAWAFRSTKNQAAKSSSMPRRWKLHIAIS